ncbi:MAG: hypothetical protein KY395_00390 [Actinobacteria bacterium]|nr:hypothetical protein [Actinomycetota bacterium]
MKRLIAGAFATALLATGLFMSAPATAATDVCVGAGVAKTGPVFYPTLGASASGAVEFNFAAGGCLSGAATVSGSFSDNFPGNYCGHSEGTVSVGGNSLKWKSAGSVLVFTGAGGGVVVAVPNALSGQSCVSGATEFLVAGLVASV